LAERDREDRRGVWWWPGKALEVGNRKDGAMTEFETYNAVKNVTERASAAGFVVNWWAHGWTLESDRVFQGKTAAEMDRFLDGYDAGPASTAPRQPDLVDDDVEWVVNDSSELGVKIGDRFFWLYKGESLVYNEGEHDNGSSIRWRKVGKREFGECCHPPNVKTLGTYTDGTGWEDLPAMPRYTNGYERNHGGAKRPGETDR
jgi:hypothetical protein